MPQIGNKTENFTQKDLMHHLLNATQHSATREELNAVRNDIITDMDRRSEQVDKQLDGIKGDIKIIGAKYDKTMLLLFSGMLAIFFKAQILSLFS